MVRFRNPKRLVKAAASPSAAQSSFKPGITFSPTISGRPNYRDWSTAKAISDGYKASTWVFKAVNGLSRTAAGIEWICYHKNADGTRGDRWPTHPFEILMREPNPYINGQDFRERLYQHLWLAGNGLSKIVSVAGIPVGLVPVMPDAIRPVPSDTKFIDGYDIFEKSSSSKSGHLQNEEVLHLMFTDPGNMYWGISPLQAVAKVVDTDNEAVDWNKVSLQNRAVTDGVFSVSVPITEEEWLELREQVREQAQGSDNAHNPWVLGYGTQWNQISLTPIEMDFLESRKNNRTEILAVYGMPPPMAGVYDNATYDNVASARLIWWLDTIIPFLDDVKIAFEFGLARKFGDDFIIDYDISQVEALKVLQIQKIGAAKDLWLMGVPLQTINNVLDLGLPNDIPGADIGYLPLTYYPVEAGNPTPAAAAPKMRQKALDTRDGRAEYYKRYDRTRLPWERQLKSLAKTQLDKDIENLASAYEQDGEQGIRDQDLSMRVAWKQLMYNFAVTLVKEVGTSFYNQLTDNGKAASPGESVGEEFYWESLDILDTLDDWTIIRGGKIAETTLNTVLDVVASSAAEGMSVADIAKSIRDIFDTSTYRSTLISRTEVVGYHNFAHTKAAEQSEVVDSKMWVSSGDDRVRPTHLDIDGTEVSLDEKFQVGNSSLDFPGDPNGDPEEIVQCRCALAYNKSGKGLIYPRTVKFPETLIFTNGKNGVHSGV